MKFWFLRVAIYIVTVVLIACASYMLFQQVIASDLPDWVKYILLT